MTAQVGETGGERLPCVTKIAEEWMVQRWARTGGHSGADSRGGRVLQASSTCCRDEVVHVEKAGFRREKR